MTAEGEGKRKSTGASPIYQSLDAADLQAQRGILPKGPLTSLSRRLIASATCGRRECSQERSTLFSFRRAGYITMIGFDLELYYSLQITVIDEHLLFTLSGFHAGRADKRRCPSFPGTGPGLRITYCLGLGDPQHYALQPTVGTCWKPIKRT